MWQNEYRTRRLLAKLNRTNVDRVVRVAVPADYYDFVGADRATRRVVDAIKDRRERAIDRTLGYSFSQLLTSGGWTKEQADAWLAADAEAPSVYDVIAAALGQPAQVAA